MLHCMAGAMLCLLLGCLVLTGQSSGFKLKAPELNIKEKELVVQVGQTIHLTCRGETLLSWTLSAIPNKENTRLSITENSCKKPQKNCSRSLILKRAQISDTGFYSCKYSSTFLTATKKISASIYIFVSDPNNPFVEMHSEIPAIVHMTEGKELVIPCRVTSPNITVIFKKPYSSEILEPDGKNIIWNNKRGFRIPKPSYKFIDILSCEATVNGVVHSTTFITNRQTSTIHEVQLNVSTSVRLLRGEQLSINCSVSTDLNGRAEIKWKYPGEKYGRIASIVKRFDRRNPKANIFYSILIIKEVRNIDQGQYICNVKNGPSTRSVNTTVRIHAKPFINVKPRKKKVLEVVAGQKSYRLAMKVRAFPSPEVTWFKDDLQAAKKCARYIVNDNSLIIKDVAEEDAGNYTIMLQLKKWNLSKNLTTTLIVNVKPQIYEKSVSFQASHLYPLGSRQSLTCTVYGVPPPTITWLWQPCMHNHSKTARCDSHSAESVFTLNTGRNNSSHGNRIHSITEHTQIIEGKNKTAGILVIEDSRASGIYTCVASNKIGSDRRDIRYYVTDIPHGFHVTMDKVPTEGDDLTLSCSINKYLYTDITWLLFRTVGNRTIQHSISKQRNSIQMEYSTSLTVIIKNATQADSGIYVCRAKNIYTGEHVTQRKEIVIRGEPCNKKTPFSWTSKFKRRTSNCTDSTVIP
ncbi:vascular endothelial growth factor receptor 1 [Discoglossus pictus]